MYSCIMPSYLTAAAAAASKQYKIFADHICIVRNQLSMATTKRYLMMTVLSRNSDRESKIAARNSRISSSIIELGNRRRPLGEGGEDAKNRKKKPKRSIRWSLGSVAMLALPATAFGLGCWQVKRLIWKLSLIEQLRSQLDIDAIPFPDDNISLLDDLEYRRVRLNGEFLHDGEFAIYPRGRFDKGFKDHGQGLVASNNISSHGAHIVTPFKLASSGRIIMINRGWVPTNKIRPFTRLNGQIKGNVTFDAIVRRSEKRPQFIGKNIPEKGIWYYKDFYAMAERYGTEPIYLEATYESTVPDGPIGGQTNVTVRNDHLNYLITWYSLAAITFAMWFIKFST